MRGDRMTTPLTRIARRPRKPAVKHQVGRATVAEERVAGAAAEHAVPIQLRPLVRGDVVAADDRGAREDGCADSPQEIVAPVDVPAVEVYPVVGPAGIQSV